MYLHDRSIIKFKFAYKRGHVIDKYNRYENMHMLIKIY